MAPTEVTNGQYMAALQWAYDNDHVTVSTNVLDNMDGSTAEILDLSDADCQITFSNGTFSTAYPQSPVVEETWYGAAAFCDWMSLIEGYPRAYDHGDWRCNNGAPYAATGYRLPTEAEWELACRAGTTTRFSTGDCLNAATEANFDGNEPYPGCEAGPYLGQAAIVGSYQANDWQLYDLHGNVWEWCDDWYGDYGGNATDPVGSTTGSRRILRGGIWRSGADECRSAYRINREPSEPNDRFGFRPVRTID